MPSKDRTVLRENNFIFYHCVQALHDDTNHNAYAIHHWLLYSHINFDFYEPSLPGVSHTVGAAPPCYTIDGKFFKKGWVPNW